MPVHAGTLVLGVALYVSPDPSGPPDYNRSTQLGIYYDVVYGGNIVTFLHIVATPDSLYRLIAPRNIAKVDTQATIALA